MRCLQSPAPLQRQLDDWSCRLYVLMFIYATSREENPETTVGNAFLDPMRKKAIELILDLPYVQVVSSLNCWINVFIQNHASYTHWHWIWYWRCRIHWNSNRCFAWERAWGDRGLSFWKHSDKRNRGYGSGIICWFYGRRLWKMCWESERKWVKKTVRVLVDSYLMRCNFDNLSRRLKRSMSTDSDEDLSDRERKFQKRSSATAKKPRKTKLSTSAWKDLLSSDEWVEELSLAPTSLRCKGCHSVVKLSNRPERPYELKNWDMHKAKCPSITGKNIIRVGVVKRLEIGKVRAVKSLNYVELIWCCSQPIKGSISEFFARKKMDMPPTSELVLSRLGSNG